MAIATESSSSANEESTLDELFAQLVELHRRMQDSKSNAKSYKLQKSRFKALASAIAVMGKFESVEAVLEAAKEKQREEKRIHAVQQHGEEKKKQQELVEEEEETVELSNMFDEDVPAGAVSHKPVRVFETIPPPPKGKAKKTTPQELLAQLCAANGQTLKFDVTAVKPIYFSASARVDGAVHTHALVDEVCKDRETARDLIALETLLLVYSPLFHIQWQQFDASYQELWARTQKKHAEDSFARESREALPRSTFLKGLLDQPVRREGEDGLNENFERLVEAVERKPGPWQSGAQSKFKFLNPMKADREMLPIFARRDELLDVVRRNRVVIVVGVSFSC